MKKTKNFYLIYLILSVLFFLSGVIFLVVSLFSNISEFSPLFSMTTGGFTQLRYYELFLALAVSSLVCGVCFFIVWLCAKLTKSKQKVIYASAAVVIAVLFFTFNAFAAYNAVNNYTEKSIYTDFADDYQQPDDEYIKFFPLADKFIDITEFMPYYSLSEYEINGSVLRTSQMFSDSTDESFSDISVTVDYFESDKSYMMTKYEAEKVFCETVDENGNNIDQNRIKESEYKNHLCLTITLDAEKRLIIKDDNLYFSFTIQDSSNSFNISEDEFVELGCEQFELMANSKNFENMPNIE